MKAKLGDYGLFDGAIAAYQGTGHFTVAYDTQLSAIRAYADTQSDRTPYQQAHNLALTLGASFMVDWGTYSITDAISAWGTVSEVYGDHIIAAFILGNDDVGQGEWQPLFTIRVFFTVNSGSGKDRPCLAQEEAIAISLAKTDCMAWGVFRPSDIRSVYENFGGLQVG